MRFCGKPGAVLKEGHEPAALLFEMSTLDLFIHVQDVGTASWITVVRDKNLGDHLFTSCVTRVRGATTSGFLYAAQGSGLT